MKKPVCLALAICVFPLASCGDRGLTDEASVEATEPPSSLQIGSAKRQCSSAASLGMIDQGVPKEAIKMVCDCVIDELVDNGTYTANREPSETEADLAMNGCIDKVSEELGV